MKSNYQFCLTEVLKSEGGYTNDPRDPGGPTNFGITLVDYRMYIKKTGTATDVKNMTKAQAMAIYKAKYWNAVNGDSLPSGVDYTVFDYGVNSGVTRANRVYKQFANLKPVDCINKINDERLNFLHGLKTWPTFGKGWSSRVSRVRADSLKLASSVGGAASAAAGGAIVAGGTAMATTPHHYWPWIISGMAAVAVISGVIYLVHEYNKGKANG